MLYRKGSHLKALFCIVLGFELFIPLISQAETSPDQKTKLDNILSNVMQIHMDFNSNTTFITHTADGFIVEDGVQGFEIRQAETGPTFYSLAGKLLSSGDEAKQIKRMIITVLFQETEPDQQNSEPANDNHPPPCRECHPVPPDYPTPPDDPDPSPPEDDECDPSTAPDGCECPQEESADECENVIGGGVPGNIVESL